ncbi:MAG: ATP-binding protein [Polaromonas sp.]
MNAVANWFKSLGQAPSAAGGSGLSSLELSLDGIVLLDAQGCIVEANTRALELLNCALHAVCGYDFWDAVPLEVADKYRPLTEQALKTSARHSFVVHQGFANTSLEYTFRRQEPGCVVNLRETDSTQRLQRLLEDSKRYNLLIFEANPNAMWVFDLASLRIFAVNQAAVKFYGIERKLFMTFTMDALFPPGEGAELLHSLRPGKEVKEGKRPASEMRLCQQKKMNGKHVLVELAWSHIQWDGREAVLVSLADISERHLAETGLKRANAELQQALIEQQEKLTSLRRDLMAFTHAASSDLQDSLHVAHGFAARLAEKYSAVLDEQGRHYVSRIQVSISQQARLIDDLKTLAQVSLHCAAPEAMDLAPICQALIANLRKRDPGRDVTIELAARLPLVASRALMTTALACLLDNAWKFTSKKPEAWIRIGLLAGKAPGEVVLRVADNGAGFDAAYIDKLFTAFQRLHSSADFPGNGLGLAIIKRVAQLQGGSVWAEGGDQVGASFFMSFPQGSANAP